MYEKKCMRLITLLVIGAFLPTIMIAQYGKDAAALESYNKIVEAFRGKGLKDNKSTIYSNDGRAYYVHSSLKPFTEYQLVVIAAPAATRIIIDGSSRKRPCDGCYNRSSGVADAGNGAKLWGYTLKTDRDGWAHYYITIEGLDTKQYIWFVLIEKPGSKNPFQF